MLDELARRLTVSLEADRNWIAGDWEVAVASILQRKYGEPLSIDLRVQRDGVGYDAALHVSVHSSGWIEARLQVGSSPPLSFLH